MNRQHRFRAYDPMTKKMHYIGTLEDRILDEDKGGFPKRVIDRMIVMQYTGLTDKANRHIYEDDIVRFEETFAVVNEWDLDNSDEIRPMEIEKTGNVLVSRIGFYNGMYTVLGNRLFGGNSYDPANVEVIGDVHQHPELLKDD